MATTSSDAASVSAVVADPDVQSGTVTIQYGSSSAYGAATATQMLLAGWPAAVYTFALPGLAPSTIYHYRVVATDPDGTVAGPDQTPTTAAASLAAGSIAATTGMRHASVNPNGVSATAFFVYFTSPTLNGAGAGPEAISADLSGLKPQTTYYFRAQASNTTTGQGAVGAIRSRHWRR